MSFLDKLLGKDEPHQSAEAHQSHEVANPVATEASTKVNPQKAEEDHGFSFIKLKEALTGGHSPTPKTPDLPPQVTVTQTDVPTKKDKDEWHEKFRDLLDLGASNRREAEEERLRLEREAIEKEVAAKEAEEKATFKGKLKGVFQSDAEEAAEHQRLVEEATRKRREAEEARRKEHSLSAKIKDVFDHDDEEKEKERQRLAEEARRNKRFGARVRKIFDHDEPPKAPEKRHPWSRTPTPEPVKKHPWSRTPSPEPRHGLKEKLNEFAGGGAKAEKREDALDKAIDFYQEHVLHEGQQKNESAFEQAKDKQIASAIREGFEKATGHELPGSDKRH